MNNDELNKKKTKENIDAFYERINDASGFKIKGVTTEEEKEKMFEELITKARETYNNIQKEKKK